MKPENFTKIITCPSEVVDVGADEESTGTKTILHGQCVVCMVTQATEVIVPCGHFALCSHCAPRTKQINAKCPLCRKPIMDLVRLCLPSPNTNEELTKAVERCLKAEARVKELEGQQAKSRKGTSSKSEKPAKRAR